MKHTHINKIFIQNFKGIANGTFVFNGENTEIVADVMQGKSTTKDAYLWCLGMEIDNFYPVDKNNRLIEGLETRVELTLDIDGIEYTLSRGAKVKYKNKVFDGYKKDMFSFDGVPCNTTEYKSKLCDLLGVADFETMKYLTVLNYFNEEVNWKDRRALIYNLFVDKTAIDGLKDSPKYDLIANDLKKGKSSADISTMLNSENNRLVDSKRRNDILLADKQNELSSYTNINYGNIESELEEVEQAIKTEQARIDGIDKASVKADLEKQLKAVYTELAFFNSQDQVKTNELAYIVHSLEREVSTLKKQGELCENSIADSKKLYNTIKAKTFNEKLAVCQECGRPLEEADANKVRATWEENHEKRLKDIKNEVKKLQTEYKEIKAKYTDKLSKLEIAKQKVQDFVPNSAIKELNEEADRLEKQIANAQEETVDTSHLDELKSQRNFLIVELGKKDSYDKLKAKIESLVAEQRELVNTEIVLLKKREQLEQYTLDIIELVNDSINSHFNGVKFKLFEELTATATKSIRETLVCLNNGVDYTAQSTGQKANSNCIIVSTLQNALGVNLPIWLDDASILNLKDEPSNQLIYLLNEKGKKLNCTRIDEIY